jgi:hypothetical protein
VRKRFGYGHETDKSPGNGDLALFCPACPQPGINIPSDWQTDPDRWVLYHFTPFLLCEETIPPNEVDNVWAMIHFGCGHVLYVRAHQEQYF